MCIREVFTEVRPDGRLRTWSEADYCTNSRHGQYCDRTQELRRPPGYRRPEPRSSTYAHGQLPPTPPLSYHSDYASDSERSNKRRSAIYINDHKMLDVNRRHSLRHERQPSGERIVYMGGSPLARTLSRTPPLYPRSGSSSPARGTYEPTYRETDSRDRERPTSIKVEIINKQPKSHHRAGSASKTSSSRDSIEDERRQRRLSDIHYETRQNKETKIAQQNEAIANRAPIPSPHGQPSLSYRRGSVSIPPVMSEIERMRLEEEKKQRRREKKEAEARERELESQKQRLKNRFSFKGGYSYA
ncbi:hypothetical protein SAMD00023353_5600500 [Rosellinia necatrix]|uniref:Uncharacterized protein n=1 Tax=Rosellinia necatrix TaxID=77044 RepID=A0A1W2TRP7_ROSNE|nr:hypothetical protein SAMD00023353_5600500 [Rosellinia necatrix]